MPTTKKKTTKSQTNSAAEPTSAATTNEEVFRVRAHEVVDKVKEIIAEGNARRIIVEDRDGKTLFTIPVTFGVVGAVLAPWVAVIGTLAAVVTECTIRVER